MRPDRYDVLAAATGVVIGLAIVLGSLLAVSRQQVSPAGYLVTTFDHPTSVFDRQLVRGDGQAYAELARDPTLARPLLFRGGRQEAAYRAQRPLLGYLGWIVSAGRAGWVGPALAIINVVAAAAAALAFSRLARALDQSWVLGPAILAAPGAIVALNWSTSEVLGVALIGAGLWLWVARPRAVATLGVALGLAGLARETFLLVPAALAVSLVASGRARAEWRRLVALMLAAAPWCAWVIVLRLRIGAWSFSAKAGRLGLPFAGFLSAARGWESGDWAVFVLLALAAYAGLRRAPADLRWAVAAQLVLAVVMGRLVWLRWQDFGRVLLPVYAIGLVTGVRRRSPGQEQPSHGVRDQAA